MNYEYFIKKNNKVKIFNSGKVAIIICNMSLYTLATALIISSKTKNETIISIVIMFIISSLFLIMTINIIIKRLVFENYYLKKIGSGLVIIDTISKNTGLPIIKIDENVYYSSYTKKQFLNTVLIKKDIFFIIYSNKVSLKIQNKNESILLYITDPLEKKIRKILSENSQKELCIS